MDIDFSLVLVCLVGACGVVWLIDSLFIQKHRVQAVADFETTQARVKTKRKSPGLSQTCPKSPSSLNTPNHFFLYC